MDFYTIAIQISIEKKNKKPEIGKYNLLDLPAFCAKFNHAIMLPSLRRKIYLNFYTNASILQNFH